MQNSVLHSYYPVGGKSVSYALETIQSDLNERIPSLFIARNRVIPYVESGSEEVSRESVSSQAVAAVKNLDVDDLKQSLFYLTGQSHTVQNTNTRLHFNRQVGYQAVGSRKDIPWGKEGVVGYISQNFPIDQLAFNELVFDYLGLDEADRPSGELRLKLDETSEINELFFRAQTVCLSAIKAISGRRTRIVAPNSMVIGRVKFHPETKIGRVNNAVKSVGSAFREEQVIGRVKPVVLKHKTGA